MSADLCPEIEGFVDEAFEDVQPVGPIVKYRDEELEADLVQSKNTS